MVADAEVAEIFRRGKQLVANITSFLGENKRVKCIVDGDNRQQFQLTSNALTYLQSIHYKHWIYDVIYDDCVTFDTVQGFGSEWFLFFVGVWLDVFEELIVAEGVPPNVAACALAILLQSACEEVKKLHSVVVNNLNDVTRLAKFYQQNQELSVHQQLEKQELAALPLKESKGDVHSDRRICRSADEILQSIQNIGLPSPHKARGTNPSRCSTRTFSRYSRHSTNSISNDVCVPVALPPSDNLRTFGKVVCGTENEHVLEVLGSLYEYHCNRLSASSKTDLSELPIRSQNLIVTTCTRGYTSTCPNKSVISSNDAYVLLSGIALQCSDTYLFDMLQRMDNTGINVLLVNTDVHGVNLPKTEDLNITQVLHGVSLTSNNDNHEQNGVMTSLKEFGVSLVLYRGCVEEMNLSEFTQNGIAVVPVKDFTLLHRLSILLSCPIVFRLSAVEADHVGEAQFRVVDIYEGRRNSCVQKTKTMLNQENVSLLRFVLNIDNKYNPSTRSIRPAYTVVVHSKTQQLCNLLEEKFWDGFGRMEEALRSPRLIPCHTAHKKLVECMKNMEQKNPNKNNYVINIGFPAWVHQESCGFIGLACEVVEKVMRKKMSSCDCDIRYQSCEFTTAVWRDTLSCVTKVLSSRRMSIQL